MSAQGREIWVFSEARNLAFELLGIGRQLADKIGSSVVALSGGLHMGAEEYIRHGADTVLTITDPILNEFHADTYVDALSSVADERHPELILIGATMNGLELGPRLAERLKTGCVTRAVRLEPDAAKEFILMDRLSWKGNTVETQISRTKPQIATVGKGIFSPATADPIRKGKIIEVTAKVGRPSVRVIDRKPKNVNFAETPIIVSIGSALKRKEDLVVIEEFAKTLGGGVKCTRPVADLGWLPHEQCVGFSAQTVAADLCLACGISGQTGDVVGIASSKVIIAINKDPRARIFRFSDYAIVADLYELLPRLNKEIRLLKHAE